MNGENSEGTKSFLSETAERAQEAITARKEFKEAQNEWMQARRRSEEAEAEYRRIVVNLRAMKEAEANAELLKNNKEHELAKAQIKYWEAVEKERAEEEKTK